MRAFFSHSTPYLWPRRTAASLRRSWALIGERFFGSHAFYTVDPKVIMLLRYRRTTHVRSPKPAIVPQSFTSCSRLTM
ncbi:uncharacterized protein LACBIDRAFT_318030 [Laccaria bicolor S238N-H82]|uniref:Predicted protein n=1 Tax=Laccaria bicolor (strain S238N-H82 / ATCC MYA-4686) TaxID=486041 RepID=B0D5T5_LACBS|nr:uncharacterized protein LACBIDRAFT_318030 [Laccaria bicolor S238N-H82]EDR10075.1 predicted protein [Laccaria bicolor S238N-H82]|eukprot:XP_001879460.1 predicted protein [Laccaria bicolor S238N-H82]